MKVTGPDYPIWASCPRWMAGAKVCMEDLLQPRPAAKFTTSMRDEVMVISLHGPMVKRDSWIAHHLGGILQADLIGAVEAAAGDPEVAGVVLQLNCPGGPAFGVESLLAAIKTCTTQKPVWSFVYRAAGNGLLLACSAHQVYASPAARIGLGAVQFAVDAFVTPSLVEDRAPDQNELDLLDWRRARFLEELRDLRPAAVLDMLHRDELLSAEGAEAAGLVDGICESAAVVADRLGRAKA